MTVQNGYRGLNPLSKSHGGTRMPNFWTLELVAGAKLLIGMISAFKQGSIASGTVINSCVVVFGIKSTIT